MIFIVLPVRNEASVIRSSIERLIAFIVQHQVLNNVLKEWRVIVADNGSTDTTRAIVREIAAADPRVELFEIAAIGKGGAVLEAWNRAAKFSTLDSQFSIFIFMDADLATDLNALPEIIAAIKNGADIAVGSRRLPGSRTKRELLRRITSWCYSVLLRILFGLYVSDPPCGFKAVNERVVREIVPLIRDTQWFFDSELLIRGQCKGMRIAEIPVTWQEPRREFPLRKIIGIAFSDLRAIWRLLCERQS